MFKKTFLLAYAIIGYAFFPTTFHNQITIVESTQETILGATYERVQRSVDNGTNTVLQTYFYLGADFSSGPFQVITGDDYTSTGYRLATTKTHAEISQEKYDQYLIIGGVNGDYFAGTAPIEAYVEDDRVISSGQGFYREVVGFKENGEAVFGTPTYDGYELVVKDAVGKERIRLPINNINSSFVKHPYDIYAYFDTYASSLGGGIPKYVIQTTETKGAMPKIYGSGIVESIHSDTHVQTSGRLVVMSRNPYLEALVQTGDQITVQRKLSGPFEGVKWAIGGWGKLVVDGVKSSNIVSTDPTVRAPRTAIGVKADGSVFFIAVDGRQSGYSQGINLYELADLMIQYGSVNAYNFDGGGSTTMVLRNESGEFDVVNQPSDGTARTVTNSIFLAVQVRFDDTTPHPIPDYSTPLSAPTGLVISGDRLTYTSINGAKEYEISINGTKYISKNLYYGLRNAITTPGTYTINARAIGDGFYYQDSLISESLIFEYPGPIPLGGPSGFRISGTTLYWDEANPHEEYRLMIQDKSYTLYLNRFSISSLNLPPGIYSVSIQKIGDGFVADDSPTNAFEFRIYSAAEKEILNSIDLIKEFFAWYSK